MEKQPLYVLDSYPALADVARVRYCAMVSRDPQAPRIGLRQRGPQPRRHDQNRLGGVCGK